MRINLTHERNVSTDNYIKRGNVSTSGTEHRRWPWHKMIVLFKKNIFITVMRIIYLRVRDLSPGMAAAISKQASPSFCMDWYVMPPARPTNIATKLSWILTNGYRAEVRMRAIVISESANSTLWNETARWRISWWSYRRGLASAHLLRDQYLSPPKSWFDLKMR